jgi:hypothetical protein
LKNVSGRKTCVPNSIPCRGALIADTRRARQTELHRITAFIAARHQQRNGEDARGSMPKTVHFDVPVIASAFSVQIETI